ncbi:MAG: bifunctional diaminohydroxyphosphoribosylaminopyrimidine deaminase/5-amino-6-(5-phosphoribosylamino)uracil reductase RibD [Bacteroidota bacterium]|nr:bifunctional diaminohydroxyphosphoribosylaminopyrimidine deaminase/5-amino-6-(5-phosphoribosylamino)uracil reductase RibD [Bacteroidota bacterium]
MSKSDEFWMKQCLNLAKRGAGYVSPNPLVGAVIVRNGKKISQGYHAIYGGPHAEVNAIDIAIKKKKQLAGTTLYVNLEPCFHFGKTPPCVDAVIKHGISRVVIATKDPNPLVAGKSIKKLEKNGINCLTGVLKQEAEQLNEKFFSFIHKKIPFIAIKAAQTNDGFIAQTNGNSKWITNKLSRKFVHQLRNEYDAVIVGANTVHSDNPELTVRDVKGRNPLRIVVDGKLSVNLSDKVFNDKAPTIVYTTKKKSIANQKKILHLEKKGVVVAQLRGSNGRLKILDIIKDLGKHQISSLLIEGGQNTFTEFINSGLVDKVYLFTAKKKYGNGLKTFDKNSRPIRLTKHSQRYFGTDLLEEFYIHRK